MNRAYQILTGRTFGKLTVLSEAPRTAKYRMWHCRCECGVERPIRADHLTRENGVRTCGGCARSETLASLGESRHQLYGAWRLMLARCTNPQAHNYRWYGALGVRVCARWRASFSAFVADVEGAIGPRPTGYTLDRFPNKHGNYEPGNVRWATKIQQSNNARNNLLFTIDGRTLTLKQWAREFGVKYLALYRQVQIRGMTIEDALRHVQARLTSRTQGS